MCGFDNDLVGIRVTSLVALSIERCLAEYWWRGLNKNGNIFDLFFVVISNIYSFNNVILFLRIHYYYSFSYLAYRLYYIIIVLVGPCVVLRTITEA